MNHDEMERAIEFMLGHQAVLDGSLATLTQNVETLTQNVETSTQNITSLTGEVRSLTQEMREAFNNLIVANEATRELATQAAKLAYSASQRVTKLEEARDK
jgi:chromosome segregation ATPase